jgi:hypothetical protein
VLVCIESLLKSLVLRESDPSATPESEQLCTRPAMAGDRAVGVQSCGKGLSRLVSRAINAQALGGKLCLPCVKSVPRLNPGLHWRQYPGPGPSCTRSIGASGNVTGSLRAEEQKTQQRCGAGDSVPRSLHDNVFRCRSLTVRSIACASPITKSAESIAYTCMHVRDTCKVAWEVAGNQA